jgi:hypothetical protein
LIFQVGDLDDFGGESVPLRFVPQA